MNDPCQQVWKFKGKKKKKKNTKFQVAFKTWIHFTATTIYIRLPCQTIVVVVDTVIILGDIEKITHWLGYC